jgi:hypothetical protein
MPQKIEAKRAGSPVPESSGRGRMLPPKDAADFLHLSTSWLAKARMSGDGPPYAKFGRSVRYSEDALALWMKSRLRLSTSER